MTFLERARAAAERVQKEAQVWAAVAQDPRTPRKARWLLIAAAAYAVSPIDLVPDFLPGAGHLDDVAIVGGLVWLAVRMVPPEVVAEHRRLAGLEVEAGEERAARPRPGRSGPA